MALTSSTMINRRRPEDKGGALPIIITSSGPKHAAARRRVSTPRKGKALRGSLGAILLLAVPLVLLLVFLGRVLGGMVDLSFLGGVFTMGIMQRQQQSTSSASAGDDIGDLEANFPDGWEEYTYNHIRDHFDCKYRSRDNEKALPTLEDWQLMRRTFTDAVDNDKEWDDPVPPTLGYSLERDLPVPPPWYPKFSEGKGRGLFASRDIKEGELVHDGRHSDVIFPDAMAWRRYVFSLPRDLACDSTDWHWMQKLTDDDDAGYYMVAGINISSLMNSGGKEFGPGREPNALPHSSTSGRFYATRDIDKGEEVLTDYDAYETNWRKVGL